MITVLETRTPAALALVWEAACCPGSGRLAIAISTGLTGVVRDLPAKNKTKLMNCEEYTVADLTPRMFFNYRESTVGMHRRQHRVSLHSTWEREGCPTMSHSDLLLLQKIEQALPKNPLTQGSLPYLEHCEMSEQGHKPRMH